MLLFNKDGQFCRDGDKVICALSIDPNTGAITSVLRAVEQTAPVLKYDAPLTAPPSPEQRLINELDAAFKG